MGRTLSLEFPASPKGVENLSSTPPQEIKSQWVGEEVRSGALNVYMCGGVW